MTTTSRPARRLARPATWARRKPVPRTSRRRSRRDLDVDDQARPALGGFDAGADEFGAATAAPPPTATSTSRPPGNTNPPGVAGTADDADIYRWNGTAFSRAVDVRRPVRARRSQRRRVRRVDATHFYVSFTGNRDPAGLGSVADEDVVYYDAGTWSMCFDGSATMGTPWRAIDLEAISVVGTTLYFTTDTVRRLPGRSRR